MLNGCSKAVRQTFIERSVIDCLQYVVVVHVLPAAVVHIVCDGARHVRPPRAALRRLPVNRAECPAQHAVTAYDRHGGERDTKCKREQE